MNTIINPDEMRIDLHHVKLLTGLGRTSVYGRIANGDFPRPIKLGQKSVWILGEVRAWNDEKAKTRSAT